MNRFIWENTENRGRARWDTDGKVVG